MASERNKTKLTRRAWLQASTLGTAACLPGCGAVSGTPAATTERSKDMTYDVVIVGGGPGGLSAALALGRARWRVLLCDSGAPRNAAAAHIHNFVTRDGTSPTEFRRIGREQLGTYPSVEVRDARVGSIEGKRGAFRVAVGANTVVARRVILCTGMIDEMLPIQGFEKLWGHAIFQCPYCHGWEVRDTRWGHLAGAVEELHFTELLTNWTEHVTVFTNGAFEVPVERVERLRAAGIRLERTPIESLAGEGKNLEGVVLTGGERVPCDVLYAHPPQRQVDIVKQLGLTLDDHGLVSADSMTLETSVPGIHAAGDLSSRPQAAIAAATAGTQAAGMLNHLLTAELLAEKMT